MINKELKYEIIQNPNLWEIETDEGWKDFQGVALTEKSSTIILTFSDGTILECSDDHLLFDDDFNTIEASKLRLGESVISRGKNITLINTKQNPKTQNLFDIYMSDNERYYSNGILSHNCGKSTAFEIFVCHYVIFHEQKSVAILANKAMSATNILRKVKVAYELLPKWLQSGVKMWNNSQIELENGCNVLAAATSSSAVRSFSINVLIIDEMAFISANLWTEFFSSVYPTVSSSKTSKTILVSTPNGMNHFYRYWQKATTKDPNLRNTFNPIKVHWSEVPGRDDQWYKDTMSNMTDEEFNREFEGKFLGSSLTLIKSDSLEKLSFIHEKKTTQLHDLLNEHDRFLRVFKTVKKGHSYIMSVDSSKLTEESSGDPVAIQIIDITRYPFQQVAVFQAQNGMHYLQIPEIAYTMGKYYNWAYAFVENNEIGQQIVDSLAYDFEYENVFYEKPNIAGYRTTKKTKRLGCSNLKGWIERGKLKVNDPYTIEELSTFIKQKNGSYAAEATYTDDLVMSLMGCLFFTTRPEFDAFTDMKQMADVLFNEDRLKETKIAIEEELPAFGVMDDGVSSDGGEDNSWLFD